ncbi:MAG: hypothetical protein ABSG31_18310 [Tepidisphaeraceae bacterium]
MSKLRCALAYAVVVASFTSIDSKQRFRNSPSLAAAWSRDAMNPALASVA